MSGTPDGEPPIIGEVPQGQVPIVREVQSSFNPETLLSNARRFLDQHPELDEKVKQAGNLVVAHGKEIVIFAGAAATIAGGIVFEYHRRQQKKHPK